VGDATSMDNMFEGAVAYQPAHALGSRAPAVMRAARRRGDAARSSVWNACSCY